MHIKHVLRDAHLLRELNALIEDSSKKGDASIIS
jgi:hypothetical protein